MDSISTSCAPVFQICGAQISLNTVDQPYYRIITHAFPEKCLNRKTLSDESKACDVTIIIGNKTLFGHKVVLSARIPFFQALFNSNMAECATGEVNLSSKLCEFDFTTVENLLDYAYTGRLNISETNAQSIMMCAVYLQIKSVMDECALFMSERVRIESILSLLFFCRSISYYDIDSTLFRFIDMNFIPIAWTPEFRDLPIDDLIYVLQRDSLYIDDETQVFEAVNRWMGEDGDRKKHGARLLRCVRCTRLSENFIADVIETTKWVVGSPECITLIDEAKACFGLKEMRVEFKSFQRKERVCDDARRLVFAIGRGNNDNSEEVTMEIYDPVSDTWTRCDNQKKVSGSSVAVLGQNIYFFGSPCVTDPCHIFDTVANEWHQNSTMQSERFCGTIGVTDGKIYVIGGFGMCRNSFMRMPSMESYDLLSNEWASLAPMSKMRSSPACCAFEGKLYVFGGHLLRDGECYDPKTDRWTPVAPMRHKRMSCSAAVLNGLIYVVGGYDGEDLSCVERYDPATENWIAVKSMSRGRYIMRRAVFLSA